MPLILGTNSIKDTGYNVANSLRFNSGSSDRLTRSFSAGSSSLWTWSGWIKRSKLGSRQSIFTAFSDSSNVTRMEFTANDELKFNDENGGNTNGRIVSSAKYRDPSAWMHIVFHWDSSDSTSADRLRMFVNNVRVTDFSDTGNAPSTTSRLNTAITHELGSENNGTFFEGYMAEVVFINGANLDPDQFGEYDEDSPTIWKPKDVSGLTFGTTGFYLDFEDSSALGNDVSGNNNDWSVSNLTSTDQSTDTCTNNFCTMNSSYPDGSITFSEGNLKLTQSSSSWRSAGGTIAVSTGKWYWETKTTGDYTFVGFADIQLFNEGCSVRESFTTGATTAATAFSLRNNDPRIHSVNTSGAQTVISDSTYSASAFTSATIGIALNLDDNEASWYINGTVQNSGTPLSISAGTYVPGISIYATNLELNFGSPPYSISSGNADANGFGNFEYAVPSGYLALCTKNLAESG